MMPPPMMTTSADSGMRFLQGTMRQDFTNSQIQTRPSPKLAAIAELSGDQATPCANSSEASVGTSVTSAAPPFCASQSLTEPSADAEARYFPSGDQPTEMTLL